MNADDTAPNAASPSEGTAKETSTDSTVSAKLGYFHRGWSHLPGFLTTACGYKEGGVTLHEAADDYREAFHKGVKPALKLCGGEVCGAATLGVLGIAGVAMGVVAAVNTTLVTIKSKLPSVMTFIREDEKGVAEPPLK